MTNAGNTQKESKETFALTAGSLDDNGRESLCRLSRSCLLSPFLLFVFHPTPSNSLLSMARGEAHQGRSFVVQPSDHKQ